MTSEDFQRLDRLFNEALEQGPERAVSHVIKNTSAGPLRDRLLKMLAAGGSEVDAIVDSALDDHGRIGQQVGQFRLLRVLGEGGMGCVYLAKRAEGDFEQEVAIKIQRRPLRQAGAHNEIFLRERQLLAQLKHPNIAHLIDGGSTDAGEPYVVMEYVHGLPLIEYCDQHALDVHARLALFVRICDAVQHAHQRLIVHRDLKPANILVDERGVPKLLDFGIAKLLSEGDPVSDSVPTVAGMMTPQYASPEQICGKAVTTASDVYSLGVILYELLCGRRPFDFSDLSLLEVERIITTRNPELPSAAKGPVELPAGLMTDLDQVVLMALRSEPEQRYRSAAALAADVQCVLEARPVAARPDSFAYRLRKLVKRHPIPSALSVILATVLVGATMLLSLQSLRLAQQRDLARQEARAAAAVSDFMVGLFQVSDPLESGEQEVSARELLQRGAERIGEQLADAPATQARLLQITALAYANLGDLEAGLPLLQQSIAIRRDLGSSARNDLAESLNRLGNYQRDAGRLEEARLLISESVAIRESLAEGEGNSDLADSYNNYGLLLYDMALYEEAQQALQKALSMHRAVSGNSHMYVGIALHNLALISQATGRYAQAEALADEALAVKRSVESEDHPSYANTLELKAGVLRRQGQFDAALEVIFAARNNKLKHYPDDHPRVATNIRNEALVYWDQGNLALAQRTLDTALAKLKVRPADRRTYIYRMTRLAGELALDAGNLDLAATSLGAASDMAKAIYGPEHPAYAHAAVARAELLLTNGNAADAESLLEAAISVYTDRLPPTSYRGYHARALRLRAEAIRRSDRGPCGKLATLVTEASPHVVSRQAGTLWAEHALCLDQFDKSDMRAAALKALQFLRQTLPETNRDIMALVGLSQTGVSP